MKRTFVDRLNQILPRLMTPEFLSSRGLGNEIGFWIFDYPPEQEMEMRNFLQTVILPKLDKNTPRIITNAINLFDLVIDFLKERNLLDKVIKMQQEKGNDAILASLRPVLKEDKLAQRIADQIQETSPDLLIIWGVGSAYPMLRTHTLLSALHPLLQKTPLLLLYPGRYDGHSLRIFNKLGSDHYYRAFRLVD